MKNKRIEILFNLVRHHKNSSGFVRCLDIVDFLDYLQETYHKGDLQHNETLLREHLRRLETETV